MGNESSKRTPVPGLSGISRGPSNSTVTKHLETAKKSRVLQLKNVNMKKLPDALMEVADVLRNLELSQNKIVELPSYIGQFSQLRQLHLSNNLLQSLPDDIGLLKNLEILNLASNKLSKLPQSLVGCGSLKNVNLSGNTFTIFPTVIAHLQELENINLSQNRIQELPEDINSLTAIEMNLNQNRLASLPIALAHCPRLKILRIEENCLDTSAFTKEMLESSNIALITYAGNLFQDTDFQHLDGYEEYQTRYTATRRKM